MLRIRRTSHSAFGGRTLTAKKRSRLQHRLPFMGGSAAAISHPAVLIRTDLSFGIHEKALPMQERPSQPLIADKFAKQRMIRYERCIQLTEGREEFQKAPGFPIGRAVLGYFL